jgi:hypothetical protein
MKKLMILPLMFAMVFAFASCDDDDDNNNNADVCADVVCATNASCNTNNGFCECNVGYSGDATDLNGTGCILDSTDLCENVTCTDVNSTCNDTTGDCDCNNGYTADATGDCILDSLCDGVTCGNNAECSETDGFCYCLPGFTGDATAGCTAMAPEIPIEDDINVNEVFITPSTVDSTVAQYIELMNASSKVLDLTNVVVAINTDATVTMSGTLLPNAFVVIAHTNAIDFTPDFTMANFPILDATYGEVIITYESTELLLFEWDLDFNHSPGRSISYSPAAPLDGINWTMQWCLGASNLIRTGDYGTPGTANNQCEITNCHLQWPSYTDLSLGTDEIVYGHVYVEGLTEGTPTMSKFLQAQVGYGPAGDVNYANWTWLPAQYNVGYEATSLGYETDYEQFMGSIGAASGGDYDIRYRASLDNGYSWTMCNLVALNGTLDGTMSVADTDGWGSQLYLWEVDVDQAGTDATEFVEIWNNSGAEVDFDASNHFLVMVNGGDHVSSKCVQLTGTLADDGILLVGPSTMTGADVNFPADTNQIQNGADGILLVSCDGCTCNNEFGTDTDMTLDATFTIGATVVTKIDGVVHGVYDADDYLLMDICNVLYQTDEAMFNNVNTHSIHRFSENIWTVTEPTPGVK